MVTITFARHPRAARRKWDSGLIARQKRMGIFGIQVMSIMCEQIRSIVMVLSQVNVWSPPLRETQVAR